MIAAGSRASISATGIVCGHDLGVDPRLAHPAGDELRVLGAEVDDEDRLVHGFDPTERGAAKTGCGKGPAIPTLV